MKQVTLTPAAAVGLFVAHRASQPKSMPEVRGALDAERWFLERDPVVVLRETELVGEDGRRTRGAAIEAAWTEGRRDVRLEKHVFDHLKSALATAITEGKTFGFYQSRGQAPLLSAAEATDALEAATEVEVEKAAPRVLETPKKGKVAGA
jgi:hypothetical protein